jgi:ADP-heptose:LPS heptosyltransferase
MPPRKTLVIRGGALGDFILTLPALAALRGHFPGRPLEILGYPSIASLAVAGGLADRVCALESPALARFFAPDAAGPAAAAEYFAQFDLIVSYLYDPEGVFQSNATRAGAARFVAGPHRPDEDSGLHAAEVLLRPLESLGIRHADPRPRLVLSQAGEGLPGAWLAAHPGSGSEEKNWPETKWAELLKSLASRTRWSFLLIGGEAEGDRSRRLCDLLPPGRARLAQDVPLVELAQRMKSCAGYIGHDSGITHLAAALDLPGLVLWGPTSAAVWRPMNERMRLIRHAGGLGELPVEMVLRETLTWLDQP